MKNFKFNSIFQAIILINTIFVFVSENSEKKLQLSELNISEFKREGDELKQLIKSFKTQLDDINLEKVKKLKTKILDRKKN